MSCSSTRQSGRQRLVARRGLGQLADLVGECLDPLQQLGIRRGCLLEGGELLLRALDGECQRLALVCGLGQLADLVGECLDPLQQLRVRRGCLLEGGELLLRVLRR